MESARRSVGSMSPHRAGGLAHGLAIREAALLEQAVQAAVEILHAEAQELGDEIVGTAAPGNASGGGDDLDPALHHLLNFRMSLLAGVAHGLRQVAGADEIHVNAGYFDQLGQVLD